MGRNRFKHPNLTLHLSEREVSNIVIALGIQYTDLDRSAMERDEIRPTMAYLEEKLRKYRR